MKKSKLIIVLSLFLLLSFSGIQAQSKPRLSEEQKEAVITQLKADKERLALTPQQETPFMEITKKYMSKLKDVKDSDADRKEKFKTVRDLKNQKNDEMKAMLTEKQYVTYLEIQKERRAKMKERRNQ